MDDKDIKFVTRHWRKGAFSTDKAWNRLGIGRVSTRSGFRWTKSRIAAAVAAVVVLGATAAIVIRQSAYAPAPEIETAQESSFETRVAAVKVIEFDNAPLSDVADEIRKVYGIEVTGLPEDADSIRLSLRYEGNVRGLVESINEILDTNLKIKE